MQDPAFPAGYPHCQGNCHLCSQGGVKRVICSRDIPAAGDESPYSCAHQTCPPLRARTPRVLPCQAAWLHFALTSSLRDYQHQLTLGRNFQNISLDFSFQNSHSWYLCLTLTWSTTNIQLVLSLPYISAVEVKGTDPSHRCVWESH